MTTGPEARKVEEAEFHDKLRGLYQTDPRQYAYYTSNEKFYAVVLSSDDFYYAWLRENATGKRVLDFGCGNGIASSATARFAARVTGIDISPETVRIAQAQSEKDGVAGKTTFLVIDAEALDSDPGAFDVVSVRGVLHHMDLDAALAQIHRVLARDGKAIFLEAIANNPIIHAYRKRTPHLRTAWETEQILRFEDAQKMRRYFKKVEVRTFHLAVLAAVPLRKTAAFRVVWSVLEGIDRVALRLPGLRKQGWMACFLLSEPVEPYRNLYPEAVGTAR